MQNAAGIVRQWDRYLVTQNVYVSGCKTNLHIAYFNSAALGLTYIKLIMEILCIFQSTKIVVIINDPLLIYDYNTTQKFNFYRNWLWLTKNYESIDLN